MSAESPTDGTSSSDPIVEIQNLSKSFGSIQALDDISFDIKENEVLALMGDNGAGKSTLIKILSGVHKQTSGSIRIRGEPVDFDSYVDAKAHGIETVYQELAVSPNRTAYENVYLGKEPLVDSTLGQLLQVVDDEKMRRGAREVLNNLGMDIDLNQKIGGMSGGEQQSLAVARAVQSDPDIVIMDEPTSALSVEAVDRILDLIERLKETGHTVILIDHNLEEVFEIADRMAVLAGGEFMGAARTEGLTQDTLVQMMMGRGKEDLRI